MSKKKIKVGIIGLGFIGKVHAQAYRSIPFSFPDASVEAEISAILRTSIGRDEAFIQTLGDPLITTDSKTFYGAGVDMVDICTPNYLHLEQAKEAAQQGCHLYVEKPLGLNLAHARDIASAAEKAGVLTHTAFMKRYYPAVQQAKAVIDAGLIGKITNFNVRYYHNSYMDPLRPISWRLKQAPSGGGAMADLGVHIIDMVRYLLGEAAWVQGHTRTFIPQRPVSKGNSKMETVDVDDWGLSVVGMQNGAIGTIEATRMSGGLGDSNRMEIFGSKGSVVVDLEQPLHCTYYDQHQKTHLIGDLDLPTSQTQAAWPPAKMSMGSFMDAHSACIFDFLNCISDGRQSMINFADAVKSQEILEAGYRSAEEGGKMVTLPVEVR
jgi:predicted dehydrogenase